MGRREQWWSGTRDRVVALVLAATLTGCGLTMTRGPDPRTPPDQRPVCTETMDAPKRDSFGALGGFLTVLVGLLFIKGGDNDTVGVPLMVGGAALVVGSYASGGVGYYRVKRCRRAIADYEQRQRPLSPAPPP